jgi:uncharacterized membrane protein
MNLSTIKKIFGRGLALAIPLGVVVYVFIKLMEVLEKLIGPVAAKLGIERILGELTLTILTVFVLLVFMFLLGLLMQFSLVAGIGKEMEEIVFKFIPSLRNLKTIAAEKLDLVNATNAWKPVIVLHDKKYFPAFVIEELDDLITLYLIMGTAISEGELLITSKKEITLITITAIEINQFSKQYGKGYLSLVAKAHQEKH